MERVSEELLERAKTSTAAIDAYFSSSKQVRRFDAAASKVESLAGELGALKAEVRDSCSAVTRVEALCARKDDLSELRERISGVEPFLQQITQTLTHAQTLTEEVYRLKGTLGATDSTARANAAELADLAAQFNSSQLVLEKARQQALDATNSVQVVVQCKVEIS